MKISLAFSLIAALVVCSACGSASPEVVPPSSEDSALTSARHYICLENAGEIENAHDRLFHDGLRANLAARTGVYLAPVGEEDAVALEKIASSNARPHWMTGTYVLREGEDGVTVDANVIVGTFPTRAIRATLRGSARAAGPDAHTRAIEAAIDATLRRLSDLMNVQSEPSAY